MEKENKRGKAKSMSNPEEIERRRKAEEKRDNELEKERNEKGFLNTVVDEITETPKKSEYSKYRRRQGYFLAGFLALATYCGINLWDMHKFDKYVIKNIEIAANVPSVGNHNGDKDKGLTMESALVDARKNVYISRLKNPAIIWATPLTDVNQLEELLNITVDRTREIQKFKESFEEHKIKEDYPKWVKEAFEKLNVSSSNENLEEIIPTLVELAESEYGQRIASEYQALNNVIAGGTRISAKNLKEKHRSLLDTLDKAGGWRSIIRFQADDYKNAHAHVFVGYLMANMGHLDKGLSHFYKAKDLMDEYSDDKNLAIIRDTPELSQKVIKGLINSSIKELELLNKDPTKYSTGWWKRLVYFNQSIGGQTNPSISDMSEKINDRYWARFKWAGVFALIGLYIAGKYGKRAKHTKEYKVENEKSSPY